MADACPMIRVTVSLRVRIIAPIAGLLLCLGVAGCSTAKAPRPEQVTIAPGVALALPAPAALGRAVDAQQLVTAHYHGATFVFETRISVTPARMLVVGTDMLGRRAMTITWNGSTMQVQAAPWVPSELRPQNVLADIILMHWPVDALRAALGPSTALQMPRPGVRLVTLAGRDMIRMQRVSGAAAFWSGHWYYQNLAWGYALDIQSVEASP